MTDDKLSADRLARVEALARGIEDGWLPTGEHWRDVHRAQLGLTADLVCELEPATVLGLVAAARERDDIRARIAEATASKGGQHVGPSGSYHALALRTAAAEKERDELRAKVAEGERREKLLHEALAESRSMGVAKGRREERDAVVSDIRLPYTEGRILRAQELAFDAVKALEAEIARLKKDHASLWLGSRRALDEESARVEELRGELAAAGAELAQLKQPAHVLAEAERLLRALPGVLPPRVDFMHDTTVIEAGHGLVEAPTLAEAYEEWAGVDGPDMDAAKLVEVNRG